MAPLWRCTMRARQVVDPNNTAYAAAAAVAELEATLDERLLFSEHLPWAYMGTLSFMITV